MKKFFCSLLLVSALCLFTTPVTASESNEFGLWFEARVASNGSSTIIGWYERRISDLLGFYVLGEEERDGYRQMYAGPTFKPLSWLQVGVGVGAEHYQGDTGALNTVRYNAFAAVDIGKFYAFSTVENGGSGSWHRVHAIYRATDKISFGAMEEFGLGFGPRLELNITKGVQLWGAVLHDSGANNAVFAVNFSF